PPAAVPRGVVFSVGGGASARAAISQRGCTHVGTPSRLTSGSKSEPCSELTPLLLARQVSRDRVRGGGQSTARLWVRPPIDERRVRASPARRSALDDPAGSDRERDNAVIMAAGFVIDAQRPGRRLPNADVLQLLEQVLVTRNCERAQLDQGVEGRHELRV